MNLLLFRLAFKELKNQKVSSLLFVLSLSIGTYAFLSVDSFKRQIQFTLNSQSKAILGADIGIGSRLPISDAYLKVAKQTLGEDLIATSKLNESFTMLTTKNQSKLIEIKAIDKNYPFYGEIELTQGLIGPTNKHQLSNYTALLYPETLIQLGLKIDDKFQLGGFDFTVADKIVGDPTSIGGGFNFAPTVYISQEDLGKTKLIAEASTGYHSYLFKLKESADVEGLAEQLKINIDDRAVNIRTPQNSSQQVGRLTSYLGDFLSLASLIALFLAAFGCVYLYSSYLNKNTKSIALYNIIGLEGRSVQNLYLIHTLILSFLGFIGSAGLSHLSLPFFNQLGQQVIDADFNLQMSAESLLIAFMISTIGAVFINYPLIRLIDRIPENSLINGLRPKLNLQALDFIYYIPVLAFYIFLSYFLSKSFLTGSYFLLGLGLSCVFIYLSSLALGLLLNIIDYKKSFTFSWMLKSLKRNYPEFRFAYFSLSIGALLIALLPLLEASIQNEIKSPEQSKTPSLFLFDIQADQLSPLVDFMQTSNVKIQSLSPMIRSRLSKINNEQAERSENSAVTREQEQENRWRNRGYNLSYRLKLSESERIIDGKFWSKEASPDEIPEISIESRFADRLGIGMGDTLEFSVEGIQLEGRITSVRKVQWTSFQPNFFIQFQPTEDIKDLPQIHIMSVKTGPSFSAALLQNTLSQKFPSVSVIDVQRVAERLNAIISQLSAALQFVGFTSVLVGLLIFFAMINQRTREKRKQANLLRVLGCENWQIYLITLSEFLFLILTSLISGVLMALVFNSTLIRLIFDTFPTVEFLTIAYISLIMVLAGLIICWLGLRNVLNANPNELLKESA